MLENMFKIPKVKLSSRVETAIESRNNSKQLGLSGIQLRKRLKE